MSFIIPPALAARSFVVIYWRAQGSDDQKNLFTGAQVITNMGNKSGFVALFKNSEHNKDTIVDYLEYGAATKTWESVAEQAGIWIKGQFVESTTEGNSLGLKQGGQDTNSTNDWQIFPLPTPSQPNIYQALPEPEPVPLPPPPAVNQESPVATTEPPPTTQTAPTIKNYSDKIQLNEFMPWPKEGKEWVELINQGPETIDISDWQIDDIDGGSSPQKIPSQTLIDANQILIIEFNKSVLNNDGDEIRLIGQDGKILDSASYQKANEGISFVRFENNPWLQTSSPTPGQKNKKAVPPTETPLAEKSQNAAADQTEPNQESSQMGLSLSQEAANLMPANTGILTAPADKVVQSENEQPNINNTQVQSGHLLASQTASQNSALTENSAPEKSKAKTPLLIGVVIVLSFISAMALVCFKRKNPVDSA
ncbi:MAG: lamin tail domain-containing protein [Candidatus Portnoybacteria bacterium]|nr:lamin tail domain-containing protein [Candidatus Portnoybacteria bacterium]